jgi:uncharacterized membrane protein
LAAGPGERGAAPVFLALVLGVAVLALALVVVPTTVQVGRAQAQRAADAAALAAAGELAGPGQRPAAERAAAEFAAANGATVVSVRFAPATSSAPGGPNSHETSTRSDLLPLSGTVIVDVEREGHRASAAAARFASDRP